MKLSISLPDNDLKYIDEYASRRGLSSRSSVLHTAIDLLRESELEDAYRSAWDEWQSSEDSALWNHVTGDGAVDAAR